MCSLILLRLPLGLLADGYEVAEVVDDVSWNYDLAAAAEIERFPRKLESSGEDHLPPARELHLFTRIYHCIHPIFWDSVGTCHQKPRGAS